LRPVSAPGEFSCRVPPELAPADLEYRAVVRHPVLTLYGAEKSIR